MDPVSTGFAAYRLGISEEAVYSLVAERRLPSYRDVGRIYFDRSELERFAEGFDGNAFDREPRNPVTPRNTGSIALDPRD